MSSLSVLRQAVKTNSRTLFEQALTHNEKVRKLWFAGMPAEDQVNALTTLPIYIKPKHLIYEEVLELCKAKGTTNRTVIKFKQFTAYFKSIIYFFRIGIQNVWKNRKLVKEIQSKYYLQDVSNRTHQQVQRQFTGSEDLIRNLWNLETLIEIETETVKRQNPTGTISIPRKDVQLVSRTEQDFYKLPLFAVVLLIFAETTPIVCFLLPEIVPSTCVFPNVLKKKFSKSMRSLNELTRLRTSKFGEQKSAEIPHQTVFKLSDKELKLVSSCLGITSRILPLSVYPKSYLQKKVQERLMAIQLDNSMLMKDGNFWKLNKLELIRCCTDRSLINFSKIESIDKLSFNELQMRLFLHLYISTKRENLNNVGIIGINDLEHDDFKSFDHEESVRVHNWWLEEHKAHKSA